MLTVRCPKCDAAYQVDETKIGPQGRRLKCAKCGEIWVAKAPQAAIGGEDAAKSGEKLPNAAAPVPEGTSASLEPAEASDVDQGVAPGVDELAHVGSPLRAATGGPRKWLTLALVLCVVGVAGGGYVMWQHFAAGGEAPAAAGEFAAPAAAEGIKTVPAPEGVVLLDVAARFNQDEKAGLSFEVAGKVKNGGSQTVTLPGLQVELLDKDGKVRDLWPVTLIKGELTPGEELPWKVTFTNPPVEEMAGWRAEWVAR